MTYDVAQESRTEATSMPVREAGTGGLDKPLSDSTYPQAVCAGKDRPLDNSKTDDEMSRPSHPGHWAHYRGEGVLSFVRRSSGGAGRRGGGSRVSQKNVRGRQRKSDLGSHR